MTWEADIDADGAKVRLSRSSLGGDSVVDQAPDVLLEQARRHVGGLTLDEYTLARVIASEHGSGSPAEMACIGDADLNRARRAGRSVFDHATGKSGRYGRQSKPRPVSTARDPYVRQVRVVNALLAGGVRGIARGAVQYLDARTQRALWKQGKASHPLTVLDRWIHARAWKKRTRDELGRRVDELGPPGSLGGGPLEWVGPIDGVDAYELLLFRPRTTPEVQAASFAAATDVITSKGEDQGERTDDEIAERLALCCVEFAFEAARKVFL